VTGPVRAEQRAGQAFFVGGIRYREDEMKQATAQDKEVEDAAGVVPAARPRPDNKERVRTWLAQRRVSRLPWPEPDAIRRELGWTTTAEAEADAAAVPARAD
jgi:hypothetical protein